MRRELIFLFMVSTPLVLVGCDGGGSNDGAGTTIVEAGGCAVVLNNRATYSKSIVNACSEIGGDIDITAVEAQDEAVVDINEAGGISTGELQFEPTGFNGPTTTASDNCEALGGELVTDERGTICSDGRGGTIPLGGGGN